VAAPTADAIASAVRRCPAVADLHGGGPVRVATFLPGRRVNGVRVDDDRVQVSVVAAYGIPLTALADQVRSAVAALTGARQIDVHIADLQLPADQPLALPAGSGSAPTAAGRVL
jgi:hypothetical protein